jgi:hypothetical protein
LIGIAAVVAAGLTSCGGEDAMAEAKSCLRERGVMFTERADEVRPQLIVQLAENSAEMTFASDDESADSWEETLRVSNAPLQALGEEMTIRRQGNVVLLWTRAPSDDEAERVEGCL